MRKKQQQRTAKKRRRREEKEEDDEEEEEEGTEEEEEEEEEEEGEKEEEKKEEVVCFDRGGEEYQHEYLRKLCKGSGEHEKGEASACIGILDHVYFTRPFNRPDGRPTSRPTSGRSADRSGCTPIVFPHPLPSGSCQAGLLGEFIGDCLDC